MKRYTYDTGNIVDQVNKILLDERRVVELLNQLTEENERLKQSNVFLRANRKSCERGRREERKSFEKFDQMRIRQIKTLEKKLKDNGLSYWANGISD